MFSNFTNELLFFSQTCLVFAFLLLGLRFGKIAMHVLIALQAVMANFFVVKQIDLFSFSVTCSDVYAVGAILGLNFLQEYWGKEEARKSIYFSFLGLLFFTVMAQIHLFYFPNAFDQTHDAFYAILSQTPRIAISSIFVYFFSQKIDIWVFGFLKRSFSKISLPFRVLISASVSQAFDTILFTILALYGLVVSIFDVIVVSLLIKGLVIGLASPMTLISKKVVKDVQV